MFIVSLSYLVPVDQVDTHLAAHMEFLDKFYANGTFVLSGRKIPRTGGVLLARAKDRDSLDAILQQDPFFRYGIARFDVIEMQVSRTAPGLELLKE
ncbi:YciI family protein [Shewanella cyperi]|uniref:GTP cyclohydrolase n=1 Tax=Shewanella cyperi TaxID=2814292 RepID=A0A974XJZ3_9GAMM|nr:YciI family protein [Shewanella cyperi]QSX29699.1 GTP cyclohydrolase [Shewanella cyperi]QSX40481.1 GTP cyclohydrolase [Shewanella cyperi]